MAEQDNRHSSQKVALALVAGLAAASFFVSPILNSARKLDQEIARDAAAQQAAYTEAGQISDQCPPPATKVEDAVACKAAAKEAVDEAIRGIQELEAQKVTANWTKTMGIVALVGIFIGIASIFLLFVTFAETRIAARAGLMANQIARDTMIAQLRPWIKISCEAYGNAFCSREEIEIKIEIEFSNVGASVAKNFCYAAHLMEAIPTIDSLIKEVEKWFGPETNVFDESHVFHGEIDQKNANLVLHNPQFETSELYLIVVCRYQSTLAKEYHYTAIARRVFAERLVDGLLRRPSANETIMFTAALEDVPNYAGIAT